MNEEHITIFDCNTTYEEYDDYYNSISVENIMNLSLLRNKEYNNNSIHIILYNIIYGYIKNKYSNSEVYIDISLFLYKLHTPHYYSKIHWSKGVI